MLPVISTLALQQAHGAIATMEAVTQLLNYCATNLDATVRFIASDVVLHVEIDASFLLATKARLCIASYFYLSSQTSNPSKPRTRDSPPLPANGAINVHSQILHKMVSIAAEAKLASLPRCRTIPGTNDPPSHSHLAGHL
jgi:hypothetical protein